MMAVRPERRLLDDGRRARSMMWMMAIMLFLTVLAAALGLGTQAAASGLERQLAGRLTVQIVEGDPAKRDAAVSAALLTLRHSPGVVRAAPVDRARLAAMIRPWLGEAGADPDLPIPAMIDVDLSGTDAAMAARVTRAVAAVAPAMRVERHEQWMSPVTDFMAMVSWLALSLVLLMAAATATVVILAARAGLDTHRDTIEILHMLGSTDIQVARLFQRHIALDTLTGGAIGTAAAVVVVLLVGANVTRLGSDLLSGTTLGAAGWLSLAALPLSFALLATWAARVAVLSALRRTL